VADIRESTSRDGEPIITHYRPGRRHLICATANACRRASKPFAPEEDQDCPALTNVPRSSLDLAHLLCDHRLPAQETQGLAPRMPIGLHATVTACLSPPRAPPSWRGGGGTVVNTDVRRRKGDAKDRVAAKPSANKAGVDYVVPYRFPSLHHPLAAPNCWHLHGAHITLNIMAQVSSTVRSQLIRSRSLPSAPCCHTYGTAVQTAVGIATGNPAECIIGLHSYCSTHKNPLLSTHLMEIFVLHSVCAHDLHAGEHFAAGT
jgi:hypothetical protein